MAVCVSTNNTPRLQHLLTRKALLVGLFCTNIYNWRHRIQNTRRTNWQYHIDLRGLFIVRTYLKSKEKYPTTQSYYSQNNGILVSNDGYTLNRTIDMFKESSNWRRNNLNLTYKWNALNGFKWLFTIVKTLL